MASVTRTAATEVEVGEQVRGLEAGDGYPLRYRTWRSVPAVSGEAGTIVLLHGVMSHSGWLARLAEPLARCGFAVVGADRRGAGLNRRDLGDAPDAETLVRDLWQVVEREHADGPLLLAGWCWGAVLALAALAGATPEQAGRVSGLMLLAPALFPAPELVHALAEEERVRAGEPHDRACLESPIREEMFTRGPWLHDFILRDELRVRRFSPRFATVMRRMGTQAILQLHRNTLPVLLVLAERDTTLDPEKTRRTFERLRHSPVTVRTLDAAHGLQFEAREPLVEAVSSWLDTRASWLGTRRDGADRVAGGSRR